MTPDLKVQPAPKPLAEASRRLREAARRARPAKPRKGWVTSAEFFSPLSWLDGRPLTEVIEPYRWRLFERALDAWDGPRLRYNLVLTGRAKKNWKSSDLVLASLFALLGNDSPSGNECYLLAND